MSALSIQPTFPIFTETDGQPLENGYIWIGQTNLDPQVNPINVYFDAALTIQAAQPIRTINGYPSRNGTSARLYVNSDYSIRVMNKNGSVVYSAPAATERYSGVVISEVNAEDVIYDPPFSNAAQTNAEDVLALSVSVQNFGAVPDGITDSTAPIQAALNSGAGVVNLEEGTYLFTNLNIPENVSLVGKGSTKTFLETSTAGNAITFDGTYNTQTHGFTLNQTGSTQGKGLYLIDQYFVTMIDVTTNGFEYGLYAEKALYHYIRECKFESGTYGAYYAGTGSVWNVDWFNNVLTFENCRFNGNATIGAYIKGCEVVFINPDFSNLPLANAIGLKVEGVNAGYPAHGVQVIQPYAENTDIVFSFSYARVQIDGGFVQGGGVSTAFTSIIDVADYSTVFWNGRPRDSDYWDFGYRVTNNSSISFDVGFTQSVRASNTVDGTSSVTYTAQETTPGATLAAVASYNTAGRKINYTDTVVAVPTATPTNTGVLTDRTTSGIGDTYLVSANGWDNTALQLISGLAFVTLYNDGSTKRAAINSISTQSFTWSSIATDGTITFQQSSANPTNITFNAVKMDF
jgi:hypothetical protein